MNYKKNKNYNESLKQYQKKLGVKADGYFGNQTDKAVRNFQKSNNLNIDGIIGKNTISALNNSSKKSSDMSFEGQNKVKYKKSKTSETRAVFASSEENGVINLDQVKPNTNPVNFVPGEKPEKKQIDNLVNIRGFLQTELDEKLKEENDTVIEKTEEEKQAELAPFQKELNKYQAEVDGLEKQVSETSQEKINAMKKAGIYSDVDKLDEMKQNLAIAKDNFYKAQDEQIEISERGKNYLGKYANAIDRDYNNLTAQDFRENQLSQLTSSRVASRLGQSVSNYSDAITQNQKIITDKIDAEKEQFNFQIKEKNKLIDSILAKQISLLTGKQKTALEERKHKNKLEEINYKADTDLKKDLLLKANKRGLDISSIGNIKDINVNDLLGLTQSPSTPFDLLNSTDEQKINFSPAQ
jgi:peptidoglycan hydrolase-like protein with peptidoglycan-binding domain